MSRILRMQSNYMDFFCNIDFNFVESLTGSITAIIALLALSITYKEFFLKRRPYIEIVPKIIERPERKEGGFDICGTIRNLGNFPADILIKKEDVKIKIGDDLPYTGEKDTEAVSYPYVRTDDGSDRLITIGKIYNLGIQKIKDQKYKDNTIITYCKIHSKRIEDGNFKHSTETRYQIIINGDKVEVVCLKEKII